jgi:hypothetical protein
MHTTLLVRLYIEIRSTNINVFHFFHCCFLISLFVVPHLALIIQRFVREPSLVVKGGESKNTDKTPRGADNEAGLNGNGSDDSKAEPSSHHGIHDKNTGKTPRGADNEAGLNGNGSDDSKAEPSSHHGTHNITTNNNNINREPISHGLKTNNNYIDKANNDTLRSLNRHKVPSIRMKHQELLALWFKKHKLLDKGKTRMIVKSHQLKDSVDYPPNFPPRNIKEAMLENIIFFCEDLYGSDNDTASGGGGGNDTASGGGGGNDTTSGGGNDTTSGGSQ